MIRKTPYFKGFVSICHHYDASVPGDNVDNSGLDGDNNSRLGIIAWRRTFRLSDHPRVGMSPDNPTLESSRSQIRNVRIRVSEEIGPDPGAFRRIPGSPGSGGFPGFKGSQKVDPLISRHLLGRTIRLSNCHCGAATIRQSDCHIPKVGSSESRIVTGSQTCARTRTYFFRVGGGGGVQRGMPGGIGAGGSTGGR
jgi:hypothetical protein